MPCGRRRGRNQPNGSSAVAVRRSAATRIGTLAYVPGCHYDLVYVLISRTFSTVDTASLQCMSIWSSSPNTAAVCSTARPLRNCDLSSPRSAPTLRRGWCRWTGRAITVAAHHQGLLEQCTVVAFLLRRILWRRTARPHPTLPRAASDTVIVGAYPGLNSGACATRWSAANRPICRALAIDDR